MIKWKEPENFIENHGDVLTHTWYHKSFKSGEAEKAISNSGIEEVDGKSWEIFHVHKETEDAYYGMPMEGLGMMDCMILKSDTRPFTEKELKFWNKQTLGMYGSHSGKHSYNFSVSIEQVQSKYEI